MNGRFAPEYIAGKLCALFGATSDDAYEGAIFLARSLNAIEDFRSAFLKDK